MLVDAAETAKEKSLVRKRKEITLLETLISAKQEQLKKIKTEMSIDLSSKLCDEEDFLFTQIPCKDVEATQTSQTLNLKASETNTQENICETEEQSSI